MPYVLGGAPARDANGVPDLFAAIAPIHLPLQSLYDESQGVVDDLAAVGISCNTPITRVLHPFITSFVTLRNTPPHSEENLIVRNQQLHLLIAALVPGLASERNTVTPSATEQSRLDCWMAYANEPPVVMVEEKRGDGDMAAAHTDLNRKFVWMPHYGAPGTVEVFGIAIAGRNFEFGTFARGGGDSAVFTRIGAAQDVSTSAGVAKSVELLRHKCNLLHMAGSTY